MKTTEINNSYNEIVAGRTFRFNNPSGEQRIDPGILPHCKLLWDNGFETLQSCEGGIGHAYYEPTVSFYGNEDDLLRAKDVCNTAGFKVKKIRRIYEEAGVFNEIVFHSAESNGCPLCPSYEVENERVRQLFISAYETVKSLKESLSLILATPSKSDCNIIATNALKNQQP